MNVQADRRKFLKTTGTALAATVVGPTQFSDASAATTEATSSSTSVVACEKWPMYRHDLSNTGHVPNAIGPKNTSPDQSIEELWAFKDPNGSIGAPLLYVNQTLYAGSDDGKLYAINPTNGSLQDSFNIGGKIRNAPTFRDNILYVSTDSGEVKAINRPDKTEFWSNDIGAQTPPIVVDKTVYVGTNNHLYALDEFGGEKRWRFHTGSRVNAPAITDGTVYFGTKNGNVYALNRSDGSKQWESNHNNTAKSPVVSGENVYFTFIDDDFGGDGHIKSVNKSDGSENWNKKFGEGGVSPPVVANGTVYATINKNVHALNESDGNKKWSFGNGNPKSPPVVADGVVYIGGNDSVVRAIDASTGRQSWSFDVGSSVNVSPLVYDDVLFVGTNNNEVKSLHSVGKNIDFSMTSVRVKPGTDVTIEFELQNTTSTKVPGPAIDVGPLPEGWSIKSRSDEKGKWQSDGMKWVWLDLEAEGSLTPSLTLDVPSDADGCANISATATDSDRSTDTASATIKFMDFISIDKAVAGDDEKISLSEIQRAIHWWSNDESVPQTGGESLGLEKIQELINIWANRATI